MINLNEIMRSCEQYNQCALILSHVAHAKKESNDGN